MIAMFSFLYENLTFLQAPQSYLLEYWMSLPAIKFAGNISFIYIVYYLKQQPSQIALQW